MFLFSDFTTPSLIFVTDFVCFAHLCVVTFVAFHFLLVECLVGMVFIIIRPFTPCGAWGIHEELPGVAVSSYPLDLVP